MPGLFFHLLVEYCRCSPETFRKHPLIFPLIPCCRESGPPLHPPRSVTCLHLPSLGLRGSIPSPPSAISPPYLVQEGAPPITQGCNQHPTSGSPGNGLGFSVMAKLRAACPKHALASQGRFLKKLLSSRPCVPRSPDNPSGTSLTAPDASPQ